MSASAMVSASGAEFLVAGHPPRKQEARKQEAGRRILLLLRGLVYVHMTLVTLVCQNRVGREFYAIK